MQGARTRAPRVIGVGTTVVRALESAMRDGELLPFAETQIFITPGYRIRSVDAMVTNFHLPESTLLMMISAFAGKERVRGLPARDRAALPLLQLRRRDAAVPAGGVARPRRQGPCGCAPWCARLLGRQ